MNCRFSPRVLRAIFLYDKMRRHEELVMLYRRSIDAVESMLDSTERITATRLAHALECDRHEITEMLQAFPMVARIAHQHARLLGKGEHAIRYHFNMPSIAPAPEHSHEPAV